MKKGITVAGTLISDVFYEIDTYPEQGLLTNVRSTKKNIGGSGNIILDLAKMDEELPVKVCAIVGKDGDGDNLLSILEKYPNIKTDAITVEGSSSVTIVMNANDTKQRTFFFVPGASDVFDESYIDWEKVDAKIFHLEYLLLMKKVDAFDPEYGTHGAKLLAKAKER
ncbi:MAG: carbohydrate kinase family protein, partial [Clostridia bacterium]|nr:carbohydrate kinase family protein [Clostridia bacterium]